MADIEITIPGVGDVTFPDSMTEAQINAAATRLYKNANVGAKQPPVTSWVDSVKNASIASPGPSVGLPATIAAKAVPALATGAMQVATSPAMPVAGRVVGSMAGNAMAHGIPVVSNIAANVGGAIGELAGKATQAIANPVARGLNAVKPYAQTLSTLSGVQSGLELTDALEGGAQARGRRDTGVLGFGKTVPEADVKKGAVANQLKWLDRQANQEGFGATLLTLPKADAIDAVQKIGLSRGDATRVVMNLRVWSGMN